MAIELVNRSGYDTADLRRFLERGAAATGISHKRLRVVVTASPIRSRGCAAVGGTRMSIAIAPPSRFSLRRLARLFEHEAAHIRGAQHGHMPRNLLYSLGPVPAWARGLRIRYRGRAPDQIPVLSRERLTRG